MDRLPQLKATAGLGGAPPPGLSVRNYDDPDGAVPVADPTSVAIMTISEVDQDASDILDAFYADTEKVMSTMREMENLTAQLQQRHSENIQTVDDRRSKALRDEIDQLSEEIAQRARTAKDGLDAMSARTATLKDPPEMIEGNSAVIRIQENIYAFMVAKITACMADYQRHQQTNQKYYKDQTFRQIKIGYTNPDGSTIDDATAENLTMQVMENNMTSYVFQQSRDVLASAIETRNDIYRIEQSMRNLNQLFNDLAFLVNEQGELMDVILSNIQASTRYVEKGRKELKKARKYQKKSRKKIICCIVCVVIIVILIVVAAVLGAKL